MPQNHHGRIRNDEIKDFLILLCALSLTIFRDQHCVMLKLDHGSICLVCVQQSVFDLLDEGQFVFDQNPS